MQQSWTLLRRIAFRLLFCYGVLYTLPVNGQVSPLDLLPWGGEFLSIWLFWPMRHLSEWVGQHLLHLTGLASSWHPTGSGDTAMNYVLTGCCAVLAILAAAVWSVLDRRRANYNTLQAWLLLWFSIVLSITLFVYGFVKIFPAQFGPPSIYTLNETYGESSPMRLLWTFMGASTGYTFFGGLCEATGGLLLLFRRTRTLGALVSGAVLFNVVLLNLFYDVPVKLYSFHLLLMAIVIAAPDLPALFRLFFQRGQAQLRTDSVPTPERRLLRIAAVCLRGVVLIGIFWTFGYGTWTSRSIPGERPPLAGAWRVETASASFQTTPWTRVLIAGENRVIVVTSDKKQVWLQGKRSSPNAPLQITQSPWGAGTLQYKGDSSAFVRSLKLDASFGKGSVHAQLLRTSPEHYTLETQGFHLIHETPPNF